MFEHVFTPIRIRDMELKNRIIMPAMGTRMADEKGNVTDKLIAYHAARAKGGCALNIVEVAAVHTPSAPAHFVSISEDCHIEGHKKLTDAIHKNGGKAGLQLWQGSIAVSMDPKAKIFVVSDMNFGPHTLKAITKEEIQEIILAYGKAAVRAVEAGYDCLEFHLAHNYLPHSFLSAGFNHREDEYGGSFENRCRFPLEVIDELRKNMPEGMPLFIRIDSQDDMLENGLTVEEIIRFCKIAKEHGVDVLDVSRGNIITAATMYEVPPIDIPNGFNIEKAAEIRKGTGMLTIGVGRINTAKLAEEILAEDKVDMVVMGRAQLADAEFVNKAQQGRIEEIVHCVGCNQGCYDGFCDLVNRPHITCMRNPMIGHEGEYEFKKVSEPKKVWVIGGGVGGMETAKLLHEKGHEVTLFEESDVLGGEFLLAGEAPGKKEMKMAAMEMAAQTEKLVTVHKNTKVDAEMLENADVDEVVLAIGSSPITINLEGADKLEHTSATEVLRHEVKLKGKVAVIGGGLVGLETADALAVDGCDVTVLEMKDSIGSDLGNLRKIAVMMKMQELQVKLLPNSKVCKFTEEGIVLEDGTLIPCNCAVFAVGFKSNDSKELIEVCEKKQIPYHVIGDAKAARRALDAIAEGFEVARNM
ncbi:bile acid Fe-S flavoenzyme BaiCD [Faecalimonas sp.]